jgi:hypothetical protein
MSYSPGNEHSQVVAVAATWFRENRDTCERPIIPALRLRFGLTPREACMAIFEANRTGGCDVVVQRKRRPQGH